MRKLLSAVLSASLVMVALASFGSAAETHGLIGCPEPDKVCRSKQTQLPARVLPRPFSNIYGDKKADPGVVVQENVRAFFPLYVFAIEDLDVSDPSKPQGWYLVGPKLEKPVGWMRAEDVLEWHQTLVVSYTHPGMGDDARNPVLFFSDPKIMHTVAEAEKRPTMIRAAYERISEGEIPEGLISIEPRQYVDINDNFYVLPILEWKDVALGDEAARFLKVAAAVPRSRAADPTEYTLKNESVRESGRRDNIGAKKESLKELKVDVVFVMDMTGSMQPYLDETKGALAELVTTVSSVPAVKDVLRFGLVGFRDDPDKTSALQWRTKNFTPELVDGERLVELLAKEARATNPTPDEWSEDVYAGVEEAIHAAWRERSIKLMLIIGDASAHGPDSPSSGTGLDAASIRAELDAESIYTFAAYLRNPKAQPDWEGGERQFAALAENPGLDFPVFVRVNATDPRDYRNMVDTLTETGLGLLQVMVAGADVTTENLQALFEGRILPSAENSEPSGDAQEQPVTAEEAGTERKQVSDLTKSLIGTALIDYLGSDATPPRDIVGWISDRDLENERKRALDVSLLLSREQVNNLLQALEQTNQALLEAQVTQQSFFSALQAVVTQSAVTPDKIDFSGAKTLAQTRLLPVWIGSLPYKSEILEMSDEMYSSLTASDLASLQERLKAKIAAYGDLLGSPDRWVALNEDDDQLAFVIPMPLELLP